MTFRRRPRPGKAMGARKAELARGADSAERRDLGPTRRSRAECVETHGEHRELDPERGGPATKIQVGKKLF